MPQENFTLLEKQAGQRAALVLRKSLKSEIGNLFETTKGNSEMLQSTIVSKMKGGELQRLIIKMPHYGFKQHFGFDGVKKNGIKLQLISNTNFINDSINAQKALETLTTEIGNIRANQVMSIINF
ncbi:conserved hypothetical protein. Putative prophage protein [Tenacibaculum maritimum]|uniref:hypothetical protein n=1 Tax=Tenacibaculum maritimum TaxID=107401 RepID=UPI0012E6558A|nr:hypothetical protein [Tenacibaculum maritimum]CAA0149511.1 conserved hypothetical protein. Putative prophage protein [Tenacibaculum maritimum]